MTNDKNVYNHSEHLKMFRSKAEAIIKREKSQENGFANMDIAELMHELQVFQIELEMQNDELRLSYDELEKERAKFTGLYNLAPVGYFILDKFGAIKEINHTGLGMLDAPRADVIGRRFQDYVSKDQTDVFYNILRKMRTFKARHSCQLKLISGQGKIYYAQLEGSGIPISLSPDLQFYIAVIDITRRRQAEQRLVDSSERLKMTLEASGTGTWEIDIKKQLIYFDEKSNAILGFEPWEFDGRYETFFKLIHTGDVDAFTSQLMGAFNEEKELDAECRIILPTQGLKFIALRGHIMHRDADALRFVGIIIDITDKKKLQQEADDMRLQHQKSIVAAGLKAQENERKRISEALHDSVAQMLYGIKLNIQNFTPGTTHLANINLLLDQAITEIRNISFELAPSILKDFGLISSVEEMAKRLITSNFNVIVKTIGLRKRLDPDVEISAFRIIQELVNNSIKHGQATQAMVKINFLEGAVALTVSDNGVGFNSKTSDYLTKGSGLLSIKNRVVLFNGHFELTANAKGATVKITLKT